MKCPVIVDLQLSQSSLDAIQEIERLSELEKLGTKVLLLGQLWAIFGGVAKKGASGSGMAQLEGTLAFKLASSDAAQSGYAVYATNWDVFFQSIQGLGAIKRRQIEKVAFLQTRNSRLSAKEVQFWKAIYLGCQYE
ncbi:MAG: hypothetical protein CVV11_10740 [Gammaproteobacteria bacterium HGW-Gammaproteobacteria-15]|nr:MAG: hypothetical protein CVV11_10740 [Gammaproteobacteria bacterium HGW-Gammaproteobacteria-15]